VKPGSETKTSDIVSSKVSVDPRPKEKEMLTKSKRDEVAVSKRNSSEKAIAPQPKVKDSAGDVFCSKESGDTKGKEILVKSKREELAARKCKSSEKAVALQPKVSNEKPREVQKVGETSKQSLQDSAAANFLKSLEPSGKRMARIPKITKKSETHILLKSQRLQICPKRLQLI